MGLDCACPGLDYARPGPCIDYAWPWPRLWPCRQSLQNLQLTKYRFMETVGFVAPGVFDGHGGRPA